MISASEAKTITEESNKNLFISGVELAHSDYIEKAIREKAELGRKFVVLGHNDFEIFDSMKLFDEHNTTFRDGFISTMNEMGYDITINNTLRIDWGL